MPECSVCRFLWPLAMMMVVQSIVLLRIGWGGGRRMRRECCQLANYIMFDIDGLNCFNRVKGAACWAAWVGNGNTTVLSGRRY